MSEYRLLYFVNYHTEEVSNRSCRPEGKALIEISRETQRESSEDLWEGSLCLFEGKVYADCVGGGI
jgi:hypothetical protein